MRKLIVGITEGSGSGCRFEPFREAYGANSGRGTVVPTTGPKFRRMSAFGRDSIRHQKDRPHRGDRIIMWGDYINRLELTGNFGGTLEDTSIDDCRLVHPLAEN